MPTQQFNAKEFKQMQSDKMSEEDKQTAFCEYLKANYPDVIFRSDMGGFPLEGRYKALASQTRSGRGLPDIDMLEPRGQYKGLFFEFKKSSPFLKDGSLKKQMQEIYKKTYKGRGKNRVLVDKIKIGEYDHLEEQAKMIVRLKKRGYLACFVWEVLQAIKIFEDYMKLPKNY